MAMSDHWECPRCKYLLTEHNFFMAKYDFLCPRCGRHTLSEFVSVPMSEQKQLLIKEDDNDK